MNFKQVMDLKLKVLADTGTDELYQKIVRAVDVLDNLSTNEKLKTIRALQDEIEGYGVIQRYLDDESISEIMINGVDAFFIEKNGVIEMHEPVFESPEHIMQFVYRIASEVGREINQSRPILDARLKDGSRVNVLLSPIAIKGPVVTIRKFNKSITETAQLVEAGTMTEALSSFLNELVKTKYNIFISGGTGTGKTTLLNYLSQSVPKDERIITIEDAAEIDIKKHPHVLSLETRNSTVAENTVGMSRLIKNALRMRPDRIIVGEVRGEEVVDMLQAMNTGHEGSISTGHANSPMDMLVRLEVISASYSEIDHSLIRRQIISAIDIIIHLAREGGRRYIESVVEIDKGKKDYYTNKIYDAGDDAETTHADLAKRLINRHKYEKRLDKALA